LSGGHIDDFCRVADDEARHAQVFTILADALTDDDSLRPDVSEIALARQLEDAGESFLPHALRRRHGVRNPLGSGAEVVVVQETTARRPDDRLRDLLRDSALPRVLQDRARVRGAGLLRVAVKLCSRARDGHDAAAETHFLEQLARALLEGSPSEVAILVDASAARPMNGSLTPGAEHQEWAGPFLRRVECSVDQVRYAYSRGLGQYTVARTWRDADVRIICVDARPSDTYSLLGAVEGIGGPCGDFDSPQRQAERETAIMMVLEDFPPHFCLLRASSGGGDSYRSSQYLYMSEDMLAVDRVAATELGAGTRDSERVRRTADQWFGTSAADEGGTGETRIAARALRAC
jgi:hypothetical protein